MSKNKNMTSKNIKESEVNNYVLDSRSKTKW